MVSLEFWNAKHREYESDWNCLDPDDVDPDIWDPIQVLNCLPFIFTKGNSCSGTPSDHLDKWELREAILKRKPLYRHYDAGDYGLKKGGYQGFITMIAYTRGRPFREFNEGLEAIDDVELNGLLPPAAQDGIIRPMALQAFVPEESLCDITFLTNKWCEVHRYLMDFWCSKLYASGDFRY